MWYSDDTSTYTAAVVSQFFFLTDTKRSHYTGEVFANNFTNLTLRVQSDHSIPRIYPGSYSFRWVRHNLPHQSSQVIDAKNSPSTHIQAGVSKGDRTGMGYLKLT